MIIATIGGRDFSLASLEDAETLLRLFERAKPVEDGYISKDYDRGYYEAPVGRHGDIGIRIVPGKLLTKDEFDAIRAERGVNS